MAIVVLYLVINPDGFDIAVTLLVELAQEKFPADRVLTLLRPGLDLGLGLVRTFQRCDDDAVHRSVIIMVVPVQTGVDSLCLFSETLVCL